MKKYLSLCLILICLCMALTMPTNAATDPLAETFQEALQLLDHFYDYNAEYIVRFTNDQFIDWETFDWENYTPVIVPAAEYEAMLHKYFVIDDAMLNAIRNYDEDSLVYDAETQTYAAYPLGGFGGMMPDRAYLGYVINGSTYDVFYQHITYCYLDDVLPEDTNDWDYAESLGWPETIEYNGIVYYAGPDGYYAIGSYDQYGRKYTVEFNEDVVRIISCTDYTETDLPTAFDDRTEIIFDIPADAGVSIPDNDCFDGGTIVEVEELTAGTLYETVGKAMETVSDKYVAYEFHATRDQISVQPNGALAVTFQIPEGYSDNVTVYYMADAGTLEELTVTVDTAKRTVTAQLEHFSVYIVADRNSVPHQHDYEIIVTASTCTTDGSTTYVCACGDSYVADIVDALGHSYEGVLTSPTCTTDGFTTYTCSVCSESFIDDYVDALGHNYTSCVTAPTCTEAGYTAHTCSNCGDTYQDQQVDATGHSFGQWYESKAPTYTEPGETKRDCTHCGQSETAAIDPLTPPATEPTEPATKPTEPATEPTEPAAKPTEPAAKPTEPAAKPTEPAAKPTEPATEPTDPTPTQEPNRTGLIIAVVAVVIVLSVAAILLKKGKK